MKKSILAIVVCSFLSIGILRAQNQDTILKPDEKITVTTEYDEDGNLIRYDSIYSYSSGNTNLNNKKIDSIMKKFFPDREAIPFSNRFKMEDFTFPEQMIKSFNKLDSAFSQVFKRYQKRIDSLKQRNSIKKECEPKN